MPYLKEYAGAHGNSVRIILQPFCKANQAAGNAITMDISTS